MTPFRCRLIRGSDRSAMRLLRRLACAQCLIHKSSGACAQTPANTVCNWLSSSEDTTMRVLSREPNSDSDGWSSTAQALVPCADLSDTSS